jgi:hypothetical protein
MMSTNDFEQLSVRETGRRPAWLLIAFFVSVGIALAAVARRLVALLRPSQSGLDVTFSSHAALTLAHILPAAVFVVLAVVVLLRRSADVWVERLFFLFGALTGITAYAMSTDAVGGWVERSAVLIFNTWFLVSLGCAYWVRKTRSKREWMTRAVGILLGIATTRPVVGVFFATSRVTHLEPSQFFGYAFWIGFSINAVIVEFWLRSKRRAADGVT